MARLLLLYESPPNSLLTHLLALKWFMRPKFLLIILIWPIIGTGLPKVRVFVILCVRNIVGSEFLFGPSFMVCLPIEVLAIAIDLFLICVGNVSGFYEISIVFVGPFVSRLFVPTQPRFVLFISNWLDSLRISVSSKVMLIGLFIWWKTRAINLCRLIEEVLWVFRFFRSVLNSSLLLWFWVK